MADCCQRSIERRKLQMKEIVSTENTESTEKRERRGERLQGIPLERITPRPAGLICPEEKFRGCPRCLSERDWKFAGKNSKHWKFWNKKFQDLEVFEGKVPMFGNFGRKSSKVELSGQNRCTVRGTRGEHTQDVTSRQSR